MRTVTTTEPPQADDLPPGKYVLLLAGRGSHAYGYALAFGLPGSLIHKSTRVAERCANDADPASPTLSARTADLTRFIVNVRRAFAARHLT